MSAFKCSHFLLKMPHNGIVFLFVLAFARVHPFSSSVLNFAIWKKIVAKDEAEKTLYMQGI